MAFIIDNNSTYRIPKDPASPIRYAWEMVKRDHEQVMGAAPSIVLGEEELADIVIRYAVPEDRCLYRPEAFCFRFVKDGGRTELHIAANDDLGLVFGMLEYSGKHLGVDPFWFWADLPSERRSRVELPADVRFAGTVRPVPRLVRQRRGVPDRVEGGIPTREVWQPVFEALLRCGGNMVIPGTDLPKHGIHADLAAEMGLWVTHHHAEPLGAEMFRDYAQRTIPYGPNEDDRAGDEFYHHPARIIVGHWLQGKSDQTNEWWLYWATGDVDFPEQVEWFPRKCADAVPGWRELRERIERLLPELADPDRLRLKDHLLLHVELHLSGCEGFDALGKSYSAYREGNYPLAFVYASQAMWRYRKGQIALQEAEHGKWDHFFLADWLTNIESTVQNMDTLRRWLRMHGDSPDFFAWYKQFLMPETEKYIYLENTHRNPLSDDELAKRLADKFGV